MSRRDNEIDSDAKVEEGVEQAAQQPLGPIKINWSWIEIENLMITNPTCAAVWTRVSREKGVLLQGSRRRLERLVAAYKCGVKHSRKGMAWSSSLPQQLLKRMALNCTSWHMPSDSMGSWDRLREERGAGYQEAFEEGWYSISPNVTSQPEVARTWSGLEELLTQNAGVSLVYCQVTSRDDRLIPYPEDRVKALLGAYLSGSLFIHDEMRWINSLPWPLLSRLCLAVTYWPLPSDTTSSWAEWQKMITP